MSQAQPTGGGSQHSTSFVDKYRELINWKESAVAGVGAWIVGIALSYAILAGFDVTENLGEDISGLDLANWVFFESMGGSVESEGAEQFVTITMYTFLDSNWFGAGIAFHALVPLVVLTIAGYLLASRHVSSGATRTPRETIIAGSSLTLPFFAMLFLGLLIFDDSVVSTDMGSALILGILYPLIFTTIGATIKSRASISSGLGFLAGIGAFVVGLLVWYLVEDPLDEVTGIDGISDLEGSSEYFSFVGQFVEFHGLEHGGFVETHGLGVGDILPEWYVILVPLVAGAAIAYRYELTDPLAGAGEGAKIGVGYVLLVLISLLGFLGTTVRDMTDQIDGSWPQQAIIEANQLIGTAPRAIILAGIVYPVTFAAVGGIIGAKAYESQNDEGASVQTPPPGNGNSQQTQSEHGQYQQEQREQQGHKGQQDHQEQYQQDQQGQSEYQGGQ